MLKLRIIRESEAWVVIEKPSGFHTHPPEDKQIRVNSRWNALAILEKQLAQKLYPVHRLDRAASGLLLYSRKKELNRALQEQFACGSVEKVYYVLARGNLKGDVCWKEPLKSESGVLLPSLTKAYPAFSFELPLNHPRGGYRSFTLLEVRPETGRFHQIRRHFAQAGFPLLGDSRHGDRKLNREFEQLTGCSQLFLRCMGLEFQCPVSETTIAVRGRWSREWHRLFDRAGACGLTQLNGVESRSGGG